MESYKSGIDNLHLEITKNESDLWLNCIEGLHTVSLPPESAC